MHRSATVVFLEYVERIADLDPTLGPTDITKLVADARELMYTNYGGWRTEQMKRATGTRVQVIPPPAVTR